VGDPGASSHVIPVVDSSSLNLIEDISVFKTSLFAIAQFAVLIG